ncbi:IS66 family insertion sequence element accessory protein TnpA [Halioxenophilus sp. WMMB6]|uniref:IS66 family insertion sequence element accessory protein TnpA n=1 Tax=Halioxenophilus sp. WMMB6 TaxID=3073815 RepID=UPI00295E451F|nr:hypothetical protein [Halioxenophilus sp. WMMB6]
MTRLTREQWQSLIKAYETSGLTQTDCCKQHNLNPKNFSLKRGKLLPLESSASPFVQVARVAPHQPGSDIELQVGAVKLKLSASVPSAYLVDLIRAQA